MDKYEKQKLLRPYMALHNMFVGNSALTDEKSLETLLTIYRMLENFLCEYPYKSRNLLFHYMYCIDVFTFKGALKKRNEIYRELEEKYFIEIPKLIEALHASAEKIMMPDAINQYLMSQYSGHDKMFELRDWLEFALKSYLHEYLCEDLFNYKALHFIKFHIVKDPLMEKIIEFNMSFEPLSIVKKLSREMKSNRPFIELNSFTKDEWLNKATGNNILWQLEMQNKYEFIIGKGVVRL